MLSNSQQVLKKPLTNEESYVQRRQLFKNIWETSLKVNDNEDIMSKPRIIKTLRMDEIDKCPVGKSKKQRIKNLRHVCRRLLAFCDRQEIIDSKFSEDDADDQVGSLSNRVETKVTNQKKSKVKKRFHKEKTLFEPGVTQYRVGRVNISKKNKDPESPDIGTSAQPRTSGTAAKKRLMGKHKSPGRKHDRTEATVPKVKTLKKRRVKKRKPTIVPRVVPQIISI